MVSIFDKSAYEVPPHLVDRWMVRVSDELSRTQTKIKLHHILKDSKIILQTEIYRYLQYEDLKFTCKKIESNKYVVTTLLTKGMKVYDYA